MSLAVAVCVVTGSMTFAACSDDSGETEGASASESTTATSAVTSSAPVGGATTAAPVDPVTVNAIDPCALLTVDEISAALQAPVLEPVAGPQANLPEPARTAHLHLVDAGVSSPLAVDLGRDDRVRAGGRRARAARTPPSSLFEDTKQLVDGLEPVPDVGDDAYFGSVAGLQMSVLDGDVYISVGVPFGRPRRRLPPCALAPWSAGWPSAACPKPRR